MELFSSRHIGSRDEDIAKILESLGYSSLDHFTDSVLPKSIFSNFSEKEKFTALSEPALLNKAKEHAQANRVHKTIIGSGYYGTHTPSPILRNIFENPGWYTAYTPYQAEISQGRLEALINFQTLVTELTGTEIANSSLLDEGTALAEAVGMTLSLTKKQVSEKTVLVDNGFFPSSLSVLKTRMKNMGVNVKVVDLTQEEPDLKNITAVAVQSPNRFGEVLDLKSVFSRAKAANAFSIAATDILHDTLHTPPGEQGADIVVGSTQRLGIPLGFGGPHASFIATKDEYKRQVPGRIIGVSKDTHGNSAYRLALQTREQHIRREKATSNICTAQVLLAVMASMYAVYHGPKGLQRIALRIKQQALTLLKLLKQKGYPVVNSSTFDTITIASSSEEARKLFSSHNINIRIDNEQSWGFSVDETWDDEFLKKICGILNLALAESSYPQRSPENNVNATEGHNKEHLFPHLEPVSITRTSPFLTHPTFNSYHTETELMRYMKKLENKDFSLVHGMIPLGSCTMKLNAASEMIPVSLDGFANVHPHTPTSQVKGYIELINELDTDLCRLTGFKKFSFQPNSGAQGEYAGLLAIKSYHKNNEQDRDVCLIPASAHGTNPASAIMAGFKLVVVKTDPSGNVSAEDLQEKVLKHKDRLAALMITYPSTHGVYEENIKEICALVHEAGGLVYMDGANMNALVGLCKPAELGVDVAHLNLHKTFCIPHGGGGPGVGPIGVVEKLVSFLPKDPRQDSSLSVSSALYGSASILPISWAYIKMMGFDGLKKATQVAVLNANYIAKKLSPRVDILFKGKNNHVAHECIVDTRVLKNQGVTVDDIAKRLIDYGFHAPTMSWPVIGTLMIEPTESESKKELDRFCDSFLKILDEAQEVKDGKYSIEESPLRNAPHPMSVLASDNWPYKYSRQTAGYPLPELRLNKFPVSVGRVDNAYGDRNLFCSCPSPEEF